MDFIILCFIGFGTGTLGTLTGTGGGIFILPILFIVYRFSPQSAIGTSLAMIFCNTLSGTVAYAIQGRINYKLAWRFVITAIPGAIVLSLIHI